ncbi:PRC-barrel domain-containing protein [Chachezhania antarctica]|uniref:PRC-barrel domain-containing protein n=1 Tax=Chachezhania antarctica TaxID=2340860 RepID=UPI000EAD8C33|nr:PRC-barrel domain-containing protein [Chachezhania antarctica]|tara:strand:+ start:2949 stop:3434 length:486 start_codon:yes stop_codon:yes gene_type:complete
MKRAISSTLALAIAAGTAGMAAAEMHGDGHSMGANSGIVDAQSIDRFIRAENIIGAEIYTLETDFDENVWNETPYYEEVEQEWESVGEVKDIVLSRDGRIVGLIAEVGGWLDIGDSDVVLDMSDVKMVGGSADTMWNDLALVTPLTEEQLEQKTEINDSWW